MSDNFAPFKPNQFITMKDMKNLKVSLIDKNL
jgi:hypothetical protein